MRFPRQRALRLACMCLALSIASPLDAAKPLPFTIVLLPDTQNYSEVFPETYLTQTRWICERAQVDNIKFVIHLGDIVQNAASEDEWKLAYRAHQILDGVVAYSMLPGNHDMIGKDTALYNKYFSPRRFETQAWYGGHLGNKNDNNCCLFEGSGLGFMVLSFQYGPGPEQFAWASEVVRSHPERRVVLATHDYLSPDNTRTGTGQIIWEGFVRKHPTIFMVVSGHTGPVGLKTSTNDAGGRVYEILTDYQSLPNGGNGWLRTLRFVPAENKIYVQAYSPLLDRYNEDPAHTYKLDYDMTSELKKAG